MVQFAASRSAVAGGGPATGPKAGGGQADSGQIGPKGVTLAGQSAMGGSRTGVRSLTRSATLVDEVVRPTAPVLGVDSAARAATQAVAGGPKRSSGSDLRSTPTSSAEGADLTLPKDRSTRLPTATIGRSLGQRRHQEGRLRRTRQGLLVSSSRRAGQSSPMIPQRVSERSTAGRTKVKSLRVGAPIACQAACTSSCRVALQHAGDDRLLGALVQSRAWHAA